MSVESRKERQMSSPKAQPAAKPQGAATYGMDRRLPTAWFLAEVKLGLPAYSWEVGNHIYVSRAESGMYRVLRKGVAKLVSEGVARRHFARVKGGDGLFVRVSQQQRWTDTWEEAMAESRRRSAA